MWKLLGNNQDCINSPILEQEYQNLNPTLQPFVRSVWIFRTAECVQDDGHTSALQTSSCFGISSGADALIMCILWDRRWTRGNVWSPAHHGASNRRSLCVSLLSGPWCGAHGNGMQRHHSVTVEKGGPAEGLFEQITASVCPGYIDPGELIFSDKQCRRRLSTNGLKTYSTSSLISRNKSVSISTSLT